MFKVTGQDNTLVVGGELNHACGTGGCLHAAHQATKAAARAMPMAVAKAMSLKVVEVDASSERGRISM